MPELPEVETIRRRLHKSIVGRTIKAVRVASKRTVQGSARDFVDALEGARVVDVKRRAEHLLVETDRTTLIIHLRMTGDLLLVARDAEPRFMRIAWDFDDGNALAFVDGRHLGTAELVADPSAKLAELGPEPLDAAFTADTLGARLSGARPIKASLLDQTVIAGVGNIYSDEALFRAQLSPLRKTSSLSTAEIARLHEGILGALNDSIATLEIDHEGDVPWRWQNRTIASPFLVYDRGGEPCLRCGTELKTLRVAGRTTVACPKCQSLKPAAKPRATKKGTAKRKARAAKPKKVKATARASSRASPARGATRSPSKRGGRRGRAR